MTKLAILALPLLACGLSAADEDKKPEESVAGDTQVDQPTRRPRIRFGGLVVQAGYSRWSGGWCCGYPGYGYYGPWGFPSYLGWTPFYYHPYYSSGFAAGSNMGEVKLQADLKDAEVFIDGAFAGTASERKSMWLEPGAYNLEIRAPGKDPYTKRIYVLTGKSLRIDAKLGTR